MVKRKPPPPPEDPALLARRDRRQAALAAWGRLKAGLPNWGADIAMLDGLNMRMRVTTADGRELKVWRPEGLDCFQLAMDGQMLPGAVEPEGLTAVVLRAVRG